MIKIKTTILTAMLITTVAIAIPAPDFVVSQMEAKSSTFMNDSFNYGRVPGSRVSKKAKTEDSLVMGVSLNGYQSGGWKNSIAGFNINIDEPQASNPFSGSSINYTNSFSNDASPESRVVYNYITGDIGVITNELAVIIDSSISPEEIASMANIKLKFYFDGIKTAFYEADDNTNMVSLMNEILNYVGVKRVLLDIMENEAIPN